MPFIRPVSIYSDNGRKVATVQTGSLDTTSNGELEVVDGGVVIARATGATINAFSCDTIILFEGNTETQKWAEALESGLPQKIQFSNIDGKKEQGTYWVTARNVQWDHKNGTMRGSFKFEGGANKRV
jgi:hypothetical protein